MMNHRRNDAVNRYKLLKDARTVAAQQVVKAGIRHVPASLVTENFQLRLKAPLVAT